MEPVPQDQSHLPEQSTTTSLLFNSNTSNSIPRIRFVESEYETGVFYLLLLYEVRRQSETNVQVSIEQPYCGKRSGTYRGFTKNIKKRLRAENCAIPSGHVPVRCRKDASQFVHKHVLIVRGFRHIEGRNPTTEALSFEWHAKHGKRFDSSEPEEKRWSWRDHAVGSSPRTASGRAVLPSLFVIADQLSQLRWSHLEVLWFAPDERPVVTLNSENRLFHPSVREWIVPTSVQEQLYRASAREKPWLISPVHQGVE